MPEEKRKKIDDRSKTAVVKDSDTEQEFEEKKEDEKLFPLRYRKLYINGPGHWIGSIIQIAKAGQKKHLLYENMYFQLEERIGIYGPSYFNDFLLISFHETIMKMQKNKCKYLMGTFFCNVFEVIASIGAVILLLYEYVIYFKDDIPNLFKDLDTKSEIIKKILSSDFLGLVCKCGIMLIAILLIAFVFHKLLALNMNYFKPKETWVRHSKHCYKLTSEISLYLDNSGIYQGGGINAYEKLKKRVMDIWQENQDIFQQNMKTEEKRESVLETVLKNVKKDD